MAYNIDQNFIIKLNTLVKEVIADEFRYREKNDQRFKTLHDKVFSKFFDFSGQSLEEGEKQSFRKYFYQGNSPSAPVRNDVVFADTPEDQNFFFSQLHHLVGLVTYNFDKMDLISPQFDEKDPSIVKPYPEETELIFANGLIYPCLHALEQREIAKLEKKASGTATDEKVEISSNPYQGLGQKILVKSLNGQFETILQTSQLVKLAEQENELRKKGLSGEALNQAMQLFIQENFPGLSIYLDINGKIQTFSPGAGPLGVISLDGQLTELKNTFSFNDLMAEMKLRDGRKCQYDIIQASKGTLGLSYADFQIKNASGVATKLDGEGIYLDSAGTGNNVIFFVQDSQGGYARVIVDVVNIHLELDSKQTFKLYDNPGTDLPGGPKLKLAPSEFSKLRTPLFQLYRQLQQPGEYQPSVEQFKIKLPLETGPSKGLPAQVPDQSAYPELGPLAVEGGAGEYRLSTVVKPSSGPAVGQIPAPITVPASEPSYTVKPKITKGQLVSGASKTSPRPPSPGLPGPQQSSTTKPVQSAAKPKISGDAETQAEITSSPATRPAKSAFLLPLKVMGVVGGGTTAFVAILHSLT